MDGDGVADELIFQADFVSGESKVFTVQSGKPLPAETKVFGRLVPERKDDFAWENDRVGFRMYGRRMEDELVSSGVDVWCKRTHSLIINRWYKRGDYHHDHSEGMDCYNAGEGRGCGGTAILVGGKLCVSRNFVKSRIIASGPIRFIFELTYEPWNTGGVKVSETKRITLDASRNLNRFECTFSTEGSAELPPVAIGLEKHSEAQAASHARDGWMRVWEHTAAETGGMLGTGVVIGPEHVKEMKEAFAHALAVVQASAGKPVVFLRRSRMGEKWRFSRRAGLGQASCLVCQAPPFSIESFIVCRVVSGLVGLFKCLVSHL